MLAACFYLYSKPTETRFWYHLDAKLILIWNVTDFKKPVEDWYSFLMIVPSAACFAYYVLLHGTNPIHVREFAIGYRSLDLETAKFTDSHFKIKQDNSLLHPVNASGFCIIKIRYKSFYDLNQFSILSSRLSTQNALKSTDAQIM